MHPATPAAVVELARRHLGLEKDFVVARAVGLQPDKERRRDPDQLRTLWMDLVAHASQPEPGQDPSAPAPPVPAGAAEAAETAGTAEVAEAPQAAEVAGASTPPEPPRPAGAEEPRTAPEEQEADEGFDPADLNDLDDLDDLDDAPSHAYDIEQKIKATFPGAELARLPDTEDDQSGVPK